MAARLVLTELWSTFAANAGTRLTEVRWLSCKTTNRTNGDDTLTGSIAVDETAATLLTDLTVLRLEREDATVEEWLVAEIRRSTDGVAVEVTALPARTFLGGLGVVRDIAAGTGTGTYSTSFTGTRPLQAWWYYYMDATSAANTDMPSWITYGTCDSQTVSVTLTLSNTTYLQALLNIADALTDATSIPHYLRLRRASSSSWVVEIKQTLSSSTVNLQYGHNVAKVRSITRRVAKPTAVVPVGTDSANIANAYWHLTLLAGTTLTVDGWDGVGSPIAFDDQYNGQYMRTMTNTYVQITDCTAPNTFVVASAAAFATGDKVQFPYTSAGVPILALTDPAATVDWTTALPSTASAATNFARNSAFNQWTAGAPDFWTATLAGGATDNEETSLPNWVIGGASSNIATATTSAQSYTQTFAMPQRLRNGVWTATARVGASAAGTMQVSVRTWTGGGYVWNDSATTTLNTGAGAFTTVSVTYDNTAEAAGAWDGSVKVTIFPTAAGSRNFYVDYVGMTLTTPPSGDLGSGPARLVVAGNAALTSNRTPARYEVEVIDRGRNDYATYAHELLILGASGRLVVPASEVSGWAIDSAIRIVEIARDELRPLVTTVQLAETAGLFSDA